MTKEKISFEQTDEQIKNIGKLKKKLVKTSLDDFLGITSQQYSHEYTKLGYIPKYIGRNMASGEGSTFPIRPGAIMGGSHSIEVPVELDISFGKENKPGDVFSRRDERYFYLYLGRVKDYSCLLLLEEYKKYVFLEEDMDELIKIYKSIKKDKFWDYIKEQENFRELVRSGDYGL